MWITVFHIKKKWYLYAILFDLPTNFLFLSWSCRHDILDILTLVNYEVGRGDAKMEDGMFKQSPAPMYSLRKKLLFTQLSNWWQHMELVWSLQCWTLWNNLNDDFMHVEGCVCIYIYRVFKFVIWHCLYWW